MRKVLSYTLALVLIAGMYVGITRAAGSTGFYDLGVVAGSITLATSSPTSYSIPSSYPRISNIELSLKDTTTTMWSKQVNVNPHTFVKNGDSFSYDFYLRNNAGAVAPECADGCGAGDQMYQLFFDYSPLASSVQVVVTVIDLQGNGLVVYSGSLANVSTATGFMVPYAVNGDVRVNVNMTQTIPVMLGNQQQFNYNMNIMPSYL